LDNVHHEGVVFDQQNRFHCPYGPISPFLVCRNGDRTFSRTRLAHAASPELVAQDLYANGVPRLTHSSPGGPQLHAGNSIDSGGPSDREFDLRSRANTVRRLEENTAA
jgi:hypothetical protein